jgi:hypothetical protein
VAERPAQENPFEDLVALLVSDPPPGAPFMRMLSTAVRPAGDWTSAGVEVLITTGYTTSV